MTSDKRKIINIASKMSHNKKTFLPIITVFLLIFIMLIVFSWFRGYVFTRFIDIELVEKTTVDITADELDGLIIRDEQVNHSNMAGRITKHIPEGERVKKSQAVYTYQDVDYSQSGNTDNIQETLDQKLYQLAGELDRIRQTPSSNLTAENREIKNLVTEVHELEQAYQDLESDARVPDEVNYQQIGEVVSPKSGIISYHIDGLEDKFTPENFGDISSDDITNIHQQETEESNIADDEISVRDPIFKTVNNFRWYVAVLIPTSELDELTGKNSVEVEYSFYEGEFYQSEIKKIIDKNEKSIMILELNQDIPGFWRYRQANLSIVTETKSGFLIPHDALVTQDNDEGVYIVERGMTKFKPIDVAYKTNAKVFTKDLEEGEMLITNPLFIQEGDKIR